MEALILVALAFLVLSRRPGGAFGPPPSEGGYAVGPVDGRGLYGPGSSRLAGPSGGGMNLVSLAGSVVPLAQRFASFTGAEAAASPALMGATAPEGIGAEAGADSVVTAPTLAPLDGTEADALASEGPASATVAAPGFSVVTALEGIGIVAGVVAGEAQLFKVLNPNIGKVPSCYPGAIQACGTIQDPADECDPAAVCECYAQGCYGGDTSRCPPRDPTACRAWLQGLQPARRTEAAG